MPCRAGGSNKAALWLIYQGRKYVVLFTYNRQGALIFKPLCLSVVGDPNLAEAIKMSRAPAPAAEEAESSD